MWDIVSEIADPQTYPHSSHSEIYHFKQPPSLVRPQLFEAFPKKEKEEVTIHMFCGGGIQCLQVCYVQILRRNTRPKGGRSYTDNDILINGPPIILDLSLALIVSLSVSLNEGTSLSQHTLLCACS